MCVAAIAWQTHPRFWRAHPRFRRAHPRWRLVIAANRDELHDRAAAPLHVWGNHEGEGGIIAGRDLRSGGTWLGLHPHGRCVLVTNYRVPGYPLPDQRSRGALVTALLAGADPMRIATASYNPFNLFHADGPRAHILTNHPDIRLAVPPGIHGLSNGGYDEPWPKTVKLCRAVEDWLAGPAQDVATLLPALADATPLAAADARFSSVFIRDPVYGTRCSTVLAIGHDGRGTIIERSFAADARPTGDVAIDFTWPAEPNGN